MALVALSVRPVGAIFAVGQDGLTVHLRAGLVHVVEVADAGIPGVAGDPNAVGRFGPGQSANGGHGQGEAGRDDDAGELHCGRCKGVKSWDESVVKLLMEVLGLLLCLCLRLCSCLCL